MENYFYRNRTSLRFTISLITKNFWAPVLFLMYCGTAKLLQSFEVEKKQEKAETCNSFVIVWLPTSFFVIFWTAYIRQRLHEMLDGLKKLKKILSILFLNCNKSNEVISREISMLSCLAMTKVCASVSAPVQKKYSKLDDLVNAMYLTVYDAIWIKKNDFETLCPEDLMESIDEKLKKYQKQTNLKSIFNSLLDQWIIFKESCENLKNESWKRTFFFFTCMMKIMIVFTCMLSLLKFRDSSFDGLTEEVNNFFLFSAAILFFLLVFLVYHKIHVDIKTLNQIYFVESVWEQFKENFTDCRKLILVT